MTTEMSKGKARTVLARSADVAVVESVVDRAAGRDGSGRFSRGNPWAGQSKWRSLISEGLGRDLPGEAGAIGRRAHRLYRAFLSDLPVDCASVRSLVAQRARAAALADRYAIRGAELGETTPEGLAMMEQSRLWDLRAERLSVTSLDLANKLMVVALKRKPDDVHATVASAFGRPAP
jgi:hypothetical protein